MNGFDFSQSIAFAQKLHRIERLLLCIDCCLKRRLSWSRPLLLVLIEKVSPNYKRNTTPKISSGADFSSHFYVHSFLWIQTNSLIHCGIHSSYLRILLRWQLQQTIPMTRISNNGRLRNLSRVSQPQEGTIFVANYSLLSLSFILFINQSF